MVPPHLLPIESKTGGEIKYIKDREAICLTKKQANHVYKKVEEGKPITMNTARQGLDQGTDREDDNPYKRVILNKVYKQENQNPKLKIGPYLLTKSSIYNMMRNLSLGLT